MCFAVFLYENKNFDVKQTYNDIVNNEKAKMRVTLGIILIVMLIVGITIVSHTNVSSGVSRETTGNRKLPKI